MFCHIVKIMGHEEARNFSILLSVEHTALIWKLGGRQEKPTDDWSDCGPGFSGLRPLMNLDKERFVRLLQITILILDRTVC